MNLNKLCENYADLIHHMEVHNYSCEYIESIEWELKWIKKKRAQNNWNSYVEVYNDRVTSGRKTERSKERIYHLRSIYSILQRFEEKGEYPNRKKGEPLIKRSSYYQLIPTFREIIDLYVEYAKEVGRKDSTIKKRFYKGSCFLLHLQKAGYKSLENVTEKDILNYFTDDEGNAILSSTTKREIASILQAELGIHTRDAKRLLPFLPKIKKHRKNIKYLTTEESKLIRHALNDKANNLTYRERAIGTLLYFTGLRTGDIAELRLSEIDWEKEQILLTQKKTGNPIIIPLTTPVGNALYDYIVSERPKIKDDHVFLWCLPPYYHINSVSIWPLTAKIYKAAGIRQNKGDRRGAHLFRHHLATHIIEHVISQPVISEALGHINPNSLNHYLSTDIVHLRQCALSIEEFPVDEEVFQYE